MATVDFTLEDMRKQTEEIVEQALSKERRHIDGRFDELLLVTAEVVLVVNDHVDERFAQVDEQFEQLKSEIKGVKRLV